MTADRDLSFPPGFLWGCATAAHQVEGDNRNNQWWAWEQEGGHIKDGSVSGLACDHYRRYEEDFALAEELGHNAHRLSIEWSRIEPEEGRWDEGEVEHYRRVMESLHRHGLMPLVTLHHFTNPLWFERRGGWLLPEAPELLGRYAGFVARELGELVPIWLTINEPMIIVAYGYLFGQMPPCHRDVGEAMRVARHVLLAHGRMYQAIHEAATHRPQVGPVLEMPYVEPKDPDATADREAAGLYDDAINEYFPASLSGGLIVFPGGDDEDAPELKDAWDLIGLNYYARELVRSGGSLGVEVAPPPEGAEVNSLGWEVYPEGFHRQLMRLAEYGRPIYVTENGIATPDDAQRCRYLLRHLREVHRAIQDGADVRGYLHWTLTDNFEWAEGFSPKLGLVALEPGTLDRLPRPSAYLFRDIARRNGIEARLFREHLG